MAAAKTHKKGKSLFDDQPKAQGDLAALVEQFKQNPALYIGALVFIAVCLIAGVLYRAHREAVQRDLYTAYAEALANEDPEERLAALEPLLDMSGPGAAMAEVVYVTAETAYWTKDYEKAKTLYERVRTEFPDTEYVPNAVEGIAYIAEDAGEYDAALSAYQEITQKWPASFTARRQPLNVARVEEKRGNIEAAIQSYREQSVSFPESNVAREAQAALDRLGKSHPALFAPASIEKGETADVLLPSLPIEAPVTEEAPLLIDTPALELQLDATPQGVADDAQPLEEENAAPPAESP
jgi:tetratricopeptide (TPR) repeat protein